jgi:hypothetical protein
MNKAQKPKPQTNLKENAGKLLLDVAKLTFGSFILGGILRGEFPQYILILDFCGLQRQRILQIRSNYVGYCFHGRICRSHYHYWLCSIVAGTPSWCIGAVAGTANDHHEWTRMGEENLVACRFVVFVVY